MKLIWRIDVAGKIDYVAGKIESLDDLSGDVTGKMSEIRQEKAVTTRYSGQREPDKKTRNYPHHTMKNLPQFRDKSHEEVRQYILEKKGVDIGSNFNFGSLMLWVFVLLAIVTGGIVIAKWFIKDKKEKIIKTAEWQMPEKCFN